MNRNTWLQLVVEQRLFHLQQQPAKVIAPAKGARFRRNALDTDNRQAPRISPQVRQHLGCQELLEFHTQGSFPTPVGPRTRINEFGALS
jgi:hypothetical protein